MPGSAKKACHSVILIEGCHGGIQKAKLSYVFHFTEMPCYGKHCRHEWKPPLTARPMLEDLPKEKREAYLFNFVVFIHNKLFSYINLLVEKQNLAHLDKHYADFFYVYFYFRRHIAQQSSVQTLGICLQNYIILLLQFRTYITICRTWYLIHEGKST